MHETPLFFPRGDVLLFGVLHHPVGTKKRLGIVMSHPFGEEKLWSHRVFVSMARNLARRGHTVLRFDYTGSGDSSGSIVDTSLETSLADLSAAVRVLAERDPALDRCGFVGLRLGATIAALLLERPSEVPLAPGPLVLWEPVLDGSAYLQDVMRFNLTMQLATYGKVMETREVLQRRILDGGIVNVDGYEIGRAFFEACDRTELLPTTPKRHQGPALIVSIAPANKQKPRPELQALADSYPRSALSTADEQPFWREIRQFYGRADHLESLTLDWLELADG